MKCLDCGKEIDVTNMNQFCSDCRVAYNAPKPVCVEKTGEPQTTMIQGKEPENTLLVCPECGKTVDNLYHTAYEPDALLCGECVAERHQKEFISIINRNQNQRSELARFNDQGNGKRKEIDATIESLKMELKVQKNANSDLEYNIEKLNSCLRSFGDERDGLFEQIEKMKKENEYLEDNIRTLFDRNEALKKKNASLEDSNGQFKTQTDKLERHRDTLNHRLKILEKEHQHLINQYIEFKESMAIVPNRADIFQMIKDEHFRQIEKHGTRDDHDIMDWIAVLTSEVGETMGDAAKRYSGDEADLCFVKNGFQRIAAVCVSILKKIEDEKLK